VEFPGEQCAGPGRGIEASLAASNRLLEAWYQPRLSLISALLAPLSLCFAAVVQARRALYRNGRLNRERLAIPVIVVGNITVGGTGKTPLVLALVRALRERGWRPGIVSRGYGGAAALPRSVGIDDDPRIVGDEPVMLAASACPVWIGKDRVGAARGLLATHRDVNVIVSDDGLQHYRLDRDVEIVVVDGERGFGNGWLLPAGPLREPRSRMATADAVVWNGATAPREGANMVMRLTSESFRNLVTPGVTAHAPDFAGKRVHAVAGIGNPERFFNQLQALGIQASCHAFPDHHRFIRNDLILPEAEAILMTEKDAVKCRSFADARMWSLPVTAEVPQALVDLVVERIRGSQAARDTGLPHHQRAADLR
jgi:tetraacyldisaccharide 4'-kinase